MTDQPEAASHLIEADGSMSLRTSDGKLMVAFTDETVATLRRMLTNLMYQATLPKRIANVAALREEGVTYLTLAMAATLANDLEARICAVELNWWHPSMHLYLAGQPPQLRAAQASGRRRKKTPLPNDSISAPPSADIGLAAVLRGTTPLEQALVPTAQANLHLLPAGYVPSNARSALARSSELKQLIETLGTQFDYLLLDMPATTIISDTAALSALASAMTVVVRQGVTPANTVKETLDEIKHVPVLGVILNQVQVATPNWILRMLPQE
ncbi:MAG: chromosome partitioning protein [Oscillochloridaceae bacterium umkhey_bin13]